MTPELGTLIDGIAQVKGVDPVLAKAIAMVETGGDPWLVRYEPAWSYFHFYHEWASRLGISSQTEQVLQAMSWGAMQVMGSVARELGFTGVLTQLTLPANGVLYGVLKLKSLLVRYGNEDDAIASYNAGSPRKTPGGLYVNETYVDRVHGYLRQLREPPDSGLTQAPQVLA